MDKNNRIKREGEPLNSSDYEALERQLRKITENLEQLELNPAQQERLISLTFLDIVREISHSWKGVGSRE